jgi:hypothetical protein
MSPSRNYNLLKIRGGVPKASLATFATGFRLDGSGNVRSQCRAPKDEQGRTSEKDRKEIGLIQALPVINSVDVCAE